MRHTPGPWKVNKYGGIGTGERGTDTILIDSQGIMDGTAEDYTLMAAAPDLLEALKNIENDDGRIPATIWKMRNDAIAKAEGK